MVKRCPWAGNEPVYIEYHDKEWGVPVHDERKLFEMLILEGAQAGLSWITILKKRDNYRQAFDNFQVEKVACYSKEKVEELLQNPGIIRNRRKIEAAVKNARAFQLVQKEFGSFDKYIWQFVGYQRKENRWESPEEVPPKTKESETMSRDLQKRGFAFVGPVICYSFMQAVGLVNDHLVACFRHQEV